MPDRRLLALSILSIVLAAMFIMFPKPLVNASRMLNQTLVNLDESLIRYRYVLGVLCAVMAYGLFRMALILAR